MSNIIDLSKLPVSDSSQVVNIIALNEGGNIIKTDFDAYSRAEIDDKLAEIGGNVEVDLTGYATEQWVRRQGYVTDSDVNDYVGNEIGQVEERFNDYYSKSEVDGLIADIPTGGGSADLSDYYTKSEVDTKLDEVVAGDLDLSDYYTKEQTDELIANIPTGGGDGGLYILEFVEGYDVFEYTVEVGGWERNYNYQNFVDYSLSNQSKNYEVIQAILDGRCKSVVYKKIRETQDLLVSVENGIETYRSNNIYQYLPCSFEISSCNTQNDTIQFTALLDEHYGSGGNEYVLNIVLNISDASVYAKTSISLQPELFCEIWTDGNMGWAIHQYDFNNFINNTNRVLRVVLYKSDEFEQTTTEYLPASYYVDNYSSKRMIQAINANNEMMTWTMDDNPKDEWIYPTTQSIIPKEVDLSKYYTKSQVDGISKLKNYYLKKDIYTKTEIDTKLDALVLGEGGEINLNNYYTKSETDSLVNAIDGVYVQNGYGFNILNYPKVKEAFETQTPVFVDGRDGLISVSVKAKVNSNGDMTGAYAFGWIDENTIVEWDMSEGHTDVNGTVRTVSSGGDGIYTLYYPQNYTIENYNEETGESNNENYYYSNSDRQKHNADVAKAIKNGDVKALYLQIPREFYDDYSMYPLVRTVPIWMYVPVAYRCDGIADDYIRVTGVAMKSEEGNLDELYTIGWRTSDDGANYGYYETQITTGGSSSGSGSVEDYASIYNPTIYSPNIQGEMQFQEEYGSYTDTASGIACGYKMNRANINNIWVKNLHLGTNGETVKVTSSDADATTVYAEFTTTGIKENGTLLSEKYVLKSDYDALLARIEALENK